MRDDLNSLIPALEQDKTSRPAPARSLGLPPAGSLPLRLGADPVPRVLGGGLLPLLLVLQAAREGCLQVTHQGPHFI